MFKKDDCQHVATRPPMTLEQRRASKRRQIGNACQAAIYAGVEVETGEGVKRFSLEPHDQTELMALQPQLDVLLDAGELDTPAIPYHADGELCRLWTAVDFGGILQAATAHIFYHRTYCNHLNIWIQHAEPDELEAIRYGDDLPADLAANFAAILAAAGAES